MQVQTQCIFYHFHICIASTYVCYAYLWYDFIVLVSNNMQKLFYCDMYCFEVCYVMISCIFYACCCVQYTSTLCNPIYIVVSNKSIGTSFQYPTTPPPTTSTSFVLQDDATKHLVHIMCAFYPLSISYPQSLYGQSKPKM